jgi:hypothetical protein
MRPVATTKNSRYQKSAASRMRPGLVATSFQTTKSAASASYWDASPAQRDRKLSRRPRVAFAQDRQKAAAAAARVEHRLAAFHADVAKRGLILGAGA